MSIAIQKGGTAFDFFPLAVAYWHLAAKEKARARFDQAVAWIEKNESKDKDLAELDAIDNITAVRLDVTKQDQVDAAVEMIKEKGKGLYVSSTMPALGAVTRLLKRRSNIRHLSMPSMSRASTARPRRSGHSSWKTRAASLRQAR